MIELRNPLRPVALVEPVELLRRDLEACHANIRRFARAAVRLANAPSDTPPAEIVETAHGLLAYFHQALPRHVADEDLSIQPRLLAVRPSQRLEGALRRMTAEHGPIEDLLRELEPIWQALVLEPAGHAGLRRPLRRLGRELAAKLLVHVDAEEADVFPALALLDDEAVVAIRHEMALRRKPFAGG